MFDINEVGPAVSGSQVDFRLYLPNINPADSEVFVYIIKRSEQFDQSVSAQRFQLSVSTPPVNNMWGDLPKGLWNTTVSLISGETYIYRYEIVGPSKSDSGKKVRSLFFGDPYARETSDGSFSLLRVENAPAPLSDPSGYKVPEIKDAVIYELNVDEFANTFNGIVDRLPYLESLGVNVIELMPINSIAEPSQWGYMPIFYFAPEERFGGPTGLRELVQACHARGIAVILDMVYAHADFMFPYQVGYDPFVSLWNDNQYVEAGSIRRAPNPMTCAYTNFGYKNDFRMTSVQEFFVAVNKFWLDEYHVDGFRYDHVNGFLDKAPTANSDGSISWYSAANRPTFASLDVISNAAYSHSKNFARFVNSDGSSRIIQIAEDLGESAYQLGDKSTSAVNGCWEKSLHNVAKSMAVNNSMNASFSRELLLRDDRWEKHGFTGAKSVDGDTILVLPVQYLESHDESRLMYNITSGKEWDETGGFNYRLGLHDQKWWKLQPYAIALMTCVGIPMLWAGQEFGENYGLPSDGFVRVRATRPLHWDYFYSPISSVGGGTVLPLIQLYRHLGSIRGSHPALKGNRESCVLEVEDLSRKILVFRRWEGSQIVVVAINFSDSDQQIQIPFGVVGTWKDLLKQAHGGTDADKTVIVNSASEWSTVTVPSSFGRVYLFQ